MVAEKNRFWRCLRQLRDDAADRREEAEVEHLVGLVEHEDLDPPRSTLRCVDVVEQPARRGDEHVDAARPAPGSAARCGTPPKTTATVRPRCRP